MCLLCPSEWGKEEICTAHAAVRRWRIIPLVSDVRDVMYSPPNFPPFREYLDSLTIDGAWMETGRSRASPCNCTRETAKNRLEIWETSPCERAVGYCQAPPLPIFGIGNLNGPIFLFCWHDMLAYQSPVGGINAQLLLLMFFPHSRCSTPTDPSR